MQLKTLTLDEVLSSSPCGDVPSRGLRSARLDLYFFSGFSGIEVFLLTEKAKKEIVHEHKVNKTVASRHLT